MDDCIDFIVKPFGVLLVLGLLFINGTNREYVIEHAEETFVANGYTIEGYIGYQWGLNPLVFSSYGGSVVWYHLTRGDNGIIYSGSLKRWGDEVHIYNIRAIDAIQP